jgi:hypothetical protein
MNTGTARPPAIEPEPPMSAEERLADIWLHDRRARREAALREPREGGRSA